jgi:chromate transport protein ChrA
MALFCAALAAFRPLLSFQAIVSGVPLSTIAILSTVVWRIATIASRVTQGIRSQIADPAY